MNTNDCDNNTYGNSGMVVNQDFAQATLSQVRFFVKVT